MPISFRSNEPALRCFLLFYRSRPFDLFVPFRGFPFDRHESSNTYETYLVRAIPIRRVVWPGKHNAKWHRLIRFRPIQAIIQLWLTNEFDSPTGARSQSYFQSAGRLIKIIRVYRALSVLPSDETAFKTRPICSLRELSTFVFLFYVFSTPINGHTFTGMTKETQVK